MNTVYFKINSLNIGSVKHHNLTCFLSLMPIFVMLLIFSDKTQGDMGIIFLITEADQYQYLGNCPPTPPVTQQQSIDNKLGLMLG